MRVRLGSFMFWLSHFMPCRVIVVIGNGFGTLAFPIAAERRRVGRINLKLCFPDMSEAAREKLLRGHFRMFGRGLIERCILWWSSGEYILSLIRVEGVEHFKAVKDKHAILLTPHFVGMGAGGKGDAHHTDPVSV